MDRERRRREELVDAIYAAAVEAEGWPTVLGALAAAFGGVQATLYDHDLRGRGAAIQAQWGVDDRYLASYTDGFAALNPFVDAVARLPAGASATAGELIDLGLYRGGAFYNEWVRPQGCSEFVTTKLSSDASRLSGVTVLRGPRAFDARERALWSGLSPHFGRAMRIHRAFGAVRFARDGALEALDALSVGVALAGPRSTLLFANAAAERALRSGDALRSVGGRLSGATTEGSAALARAVEAALGTAVQPGRGDPEAGGMMALPSRAGPAVPVLIAPLPGGRGPLGDRAALVMIGGARVVRVAQGDLMRAFGLTRAEARLLAALVEGETLSGYADANAVALETVRIHLRKVLSKTGTARQADAIRLVLSDAVLARSG